MKNKALIAVSLIILLAVVCLSGWYAVKVTAKYLREMGKLNDSLAKAGNSRSYSGSDVTSGSQFTTVSQTSMARQEEGGAGASGSVSSNMAAPSTTLAESAAPMPEEAASAEVDADTTEAEDSSESSSAEEVEAVEESVFLLADTTFEDDFEDYTPEDILGNDDTYVYSDDTGGSSEEAIVSDVSNRVDGLIAENDHFVEEDKTIIMEYLAIQIAESPQAFTNISDDELLQRMNYIMLLETIR